MVVGVCVNIKIKEVKEKINISVSSWSFTLLFYLHRADMSFCHEFFFVKWTQSHQLEEFTSFQNKTLKESSESWNSN